MVLYTKVDITDVGGTLRTLGDENRGGGLSFKDGEASSLHLSVSDPGGAYKTQYEIGSKVEAYQDNVDPPTTKVFRGVIERQKLIWDGGQRILELLANEYFYTVILGALVVEEYHGKKAGDIVNDLFSRYTSSFNTTNVETLDTVEDVVFNYMTLKQALDRVAEIVDAQYYCDANLNVYLHQRRAKASSLVVTESDVEPSPEPSEDILRMVNSVTVIGGSTVKQDQAQATVTGSVNMNAKYIGVKFQPAEKDLVQIQLYLEKAGSPTGDLIGIIIEDKAGLPDGPDIIAFTLRSGSIGAAGSPGWVVIQTEVTLDVAKSYWITLNKNGDASNTYKWYHDNSTTNSHVESDDGITWTNTPNSYKPSFKTFFKQPNLSKAINRDSINKYGLRETAIVDTSITDKKTAKRRAQTLIQILGSVKKELPTLTVKELTSVPQVGRDVKVELDTIGVNRFYQLVQLDIPLPPGHLTAQRGELQLV